MQLFVLRARSSCALCRSKLPPRTEVWQLPETGDVVCVTCERMERGGDTPAAPAAVQGPGPAPVAPSPLEPVAVEPPAPVSAPLEPVAVEPPAPVSATLEPLPAPPVLAPPVSAPADPAAALPSEGSKAKPEARVPKTRTPKAPVPKARVMKAAEPRTRTPKASVPKTRVPRASATDAPVASVREAPAPLVSGVPVIAASDTDPVGGPAVPDAAVPPTEVHRAEPPAADEPPVVAPMPAAEHPLPSAPVHHAAPVPVAIDAAGDATGVDRTPPDSVPSKVALLRPSTTAVPGEIPRADNVFDRLTGAPGEAPALDPAMALPIRRGDMGEGRVGQTLEGARIQGIEVLHGVHLTAGTGTIDHLVVSANGLWVVGSVPVLAGRLERRDLGDWFNADPRLFVADEDRSELVAVVRRQVESATAVLARGSFSDIPVRGVLCFGSVQPGWVKQPFVLDGVSVTWRTKLVEPMLTPVLVDLRSRTALLHALAASVVAPGGTPGDPSRQVG